MSIEDPKVVVPQNEIPSGEPQEKIETKKDEPVSYEYSQRLLGQMKTTKAENQELAAKLAKIEKAQKAEAEAKLVEQGDLQKLVELREQELAEKDAKLSETLADNQQTNKALTDTWKLQAFYDKLPGKIKKREYLDFVKLDDIVLNPETQEIDTKSVDAVVNSFMEVHGESLVDTKAFGRIPGNAGTTLTELNANNFKELPLTEMRSKIKEAVQLRKKQLGVN